MLCMFGSYVATYVYTSNMQLNSWSACLMLTGYMCTYINIWKRMIINMLSKALISYDDYPCNKHA